ncbi:adenine deaminase [Ligilactobacillus equi]|uniref:adenine deaminase n=1 Tax=Ligilactobacillus equi TaxID=137357 RepID=UPI002ED3819F
MNTNQLTHLIAVANGRQKADLLLKNTRMVDVYQGKIIQTDVALVDGKIAGFGSDYQAKKVHDLAGQYLVPGLIESHIHIESSYVSPAEFGRIFLPHGTTTIMADPHEIVNVAGLEGLKYMCADAQNTALDIHYLMPSCVPATPLESSGANLTATDIEPYLQAGKVDGLAEFMDFKGVISARSDVIAKLLAAQKSGKRIDGHAPKIFGKDLNAYVAAGILNDHECSTIAEMHDRISRGMYVMLREGTVCHDLPTLLKGVTATNSRRCVLAGDDVQAKTVLTKGHLDHNIRLAIKNGLTPITAIQMATLNAAEMCGLDDRGAIAPGKRADLLVVSDLENFKVEEVFVKGQLTARAGHYLPKTKHASIQKVSATMKIANFTSDKLKLKLKQNKVRAIEIIPGEVLTNEAHVEVQTDDEGDFVYQADQDLTKIAVVERHHQTGHVFTGLLKGYGIRAGAIAISIGHDSHNVIVTGTNDADMTCAVQNLQIQKGGITLVKDGQVIASMPLPIAGLMSNLSAPEVIAQQDLVDQLAHEELGIPAEINPIMTLSFMPLAVIPSLKITDQGLVDVNQLEFVPLEV